MNEQTPLLKDTPRQPSSCCSSHGQIKKSACCSFKDDNSAGNQPSCCSSQKGKKTCSGLPPVNDDDYCYLAEQKWEYKLIALMCAIFLAGN